MPTIDKTDHSRPDDTMTTPVTFRTLLASAALLVLALSLISLAVGYWIYDNLQARFVLQDQSGWIRFPESLDVGAEVHNAVHVRVNQLIPATVPIRQQLAIPVPGPVNAIVSVDTQIPVALSVPVTDTLKIDQTIDLDTEVEVILAGLPIRLPIRGQVPIQATVPLNLQIEVNNQVPLRFTAPVVLHLNEPIQTELDTTIQTEIPMDTVLELPVTSVIETRLRFPPQPVEAGLYYLDLSLPLQDVELSAREPVQP